ncbi:hypothetical protein MAP00_004028 [Monascus purpureus]|nr:hypothetical protein MAP00_004028 [Monascus purpureus]
MAYSFKTPIPNPASWFRGKSEPTEELQEDNNPTEADDNNNLEMVINASVAGKLQQGKQKFVFEYEDGTQETREVPIPLALIAKNLTLGANINYALGDVAGRKGLGNKRPFSFLNDTNVSASALLLPAPALAFSFAKAIAPVPKAKPFSVNLSTTFSGSILQRLPEIGLNVSRAVGERKIAFCSWSSGTLLWPSAKPEELIFTQLSKFQLGLLSFPARPTKPTGPIGGEEEDEEYREIRRKEREANKAREAFQFQVEASPAGGSLSFNYSRNIFSGKPADELVRSEWSPEGHYGSLLESEPRSVRLEISTTIGLDLALGWSISGIRQVGEFTRMGLDIGVEGMKGLVVSVSWRRLGQRINIPIVVCPVQMVNMDVAAIAVIFPWVAYCAVEFGFIRPRQRRERRQAVAQRRKKLEKLIPQKRAESQQTIELMTEQVRRRQAREEAQGGLVVTRAEYGYIPPTERRKDASAEAKVVDVTVPVAALVDRSQLIIPRETVKFHIVGFYDPAPLLPKKLKVWYQFNGKQHFVEADDSEGITCPMRSHLLRS